MERKRRSLTVVPQLLRGRSRIHKQTMILTFTLCFLKKERSRNGVSCWVEKRW